MPMITGTLNMLNPPRVIDGAKGSFTVYEIVVGGKRYRVKQDVYNQAGGLTGQTVHIDTVMKPNGQYENWYANAIFQEHERASNAEPMPAAENPVVRAAGAQAASQGFLTDVAKNASICRQSAAKSLLAAGVLPMDATFWHLAQCLATWFETGKAPSNGKVPADAQFITADVVAKADPYNEAIQDDGIPF